MLQAKRSGGNGLSGLPWRRRSRRLPLRHQRRLGRRGGHGSADGGRRAERCGRRRLERHRQTEKAIAAFSALAERLDALAAERAKPWWRRLAG